MKNFIMIGIVLSAFLSVSKGYCNKFAIIDSTPCIAVEKITGRGSGYDKDFSGNVGSLRCDFKMKQIYIAEFVGLENDVQVYVGVYNITKIEDYGDTIDFECVDQGNSIEWTGKFWLTDNKNIRVEMAMKGSSRKWVNLSEYGKKFLKDNKLNRLFLGL